MASPIKKVVTRVRVAAREVKDIPTAIGTSMAANMDYLMGNPADRAKMNKNINLADKNYEKQIVEAAKAILKGKTGTSSDQMIGYTEYKRGKQR